MDSAACWFSANSLSLNRTKTQSVIFSLKLVPERFMESKHVQFLYSGYFLQGPKVPR